TLGVGSPRSQWHRERGIVQARVEQDSSPALADPALAEPHPALWRATHLTRLVLLDGLSIWLALTVAAWFRFGSHALSTETRPGLSYGVVVAAISAGWLLMLSGRGAYESRFYGTGPEEYKRVVKATVYTFGVIAIVSYAFKLELARSFVAVALPVGLVLLLLGRYLARRWLIGRRVSGLSLNRVVAVGTQESVQHLRAQLQRELYAGYDVVAGVEVHGDLLATIRQSRADTVAITVCPEMTQPRLREISWLLEGTGVQLIVEPRFTDIAGPRITIAPVGGLPLLHVDEPEFTGWRRIVKDGIDRTVAALGLIALSPVLVLIAIAVRRTSPGPGLFRQRRAGTHGQEFRVVKFRTMYRDAEARLAGLQAQNESDGLLFKIKDDPRITPVGRFLRRTSLDELPQLINVLRGEMSLVGPRPLPVDDEEFMGPERRRMLVRPGITGLWQVSGRSDTSWEDAVRLDLYYVENWSITLDLMILARTFAVVARGGGAY
ncbi:MAG: sugar transferase, partial [Nocardioidaceae bacterium]